MTMPHRTASVPISTLGRAVLALCAATASVQAQQAQEPPAQEQAKAAPAVPAPAVEATVSVSAARPTNRIDRQVYDVKADPATSVDSVADTLNKVPSVAVDPDGNVSLRGRNNVQILVDGKQSAMMQGENRAAALNALPAADLESVEVINNPGAQFGNEGGGGPIINLVMRRERRPGGFASLNANAGTGGRFHANAFGSYTTGRMSLQGSVFGRHDRRASTGETLRERIDPASGAVSRSAQHSRGENRNDVGGFNGSLSYNLGDKDVLGVNANYQAANSDGDSSEDYRGLRPDGSVESEYTRGTEREGRNRSYSLGTRLDHKGDQDGEALKLDLRLSGSDNDNGARYASLYTLRPPAAANPFNRQEGVNDSRVADFTADYELPVAEGLLKLGAKAARTSSSFDNLFLDIDPATMAERVNTTRTNRFELDDSTLAVYGSYERRLDSKWKAQGGLRAEYNELDMHQVTTGIRARNDSTDLIPSAFVTYALSEDGTLRLSYAHRIRRPGAGDLNPFVVYRDELNIASGNPALKPSESDSLELGYETRFGKVDTNLRLYARRDTDLISERRLLLANDVLLTTRENAGSKRSGGLEFSFSGRATPALQLNLSGNIGYAEQTVLGGQAGANRSAASLSVRGRIGWQPDKENQFQLVLNAQGKELFGEGYRQPVRTANLSYRRTLSPALSLVLNVNDVFDSQKTEMVTETARLRERSVRRGDGRVVFLGLSYRFGSFGGGNRGPGMRPMGPPGR
ncbi:TonB-dependent receptor domain-containing protein [Massilia sp. AB1]|uniref:TonB-dependent receptor domain-containing protein n=1 Tax=Massilia sp. AB1 TaxID=2823371 RepID=UPI001E4A0E65|nr:TonB-dependent receptor [Massilia sp. AB1]